MRASDTQRLSLLARRLGGPVEDGGAQFDGRNQFVLCVARRNGETAALDRLTQPMPRTGVGGEFLRPREQDACASTDFCACKLKKGGERVTNARASSTADAAVFLVVRHVFFGRKKSIGLRNDRVAVCPKIGMKSSPPEIGLLQLKKIFQN